MTPAKKSTAAKRRQLHEAVSALALGIERGECLPTVLELAALVQLCTDAGLPQDVARIRRWMGDA